ncbi:MAG: amidohydrolase family protein [Rhodospirillaceae bacterium]
MRKEGGAAIARILIKGGTIVSLDKKVGDFAKGDVLIDGDKILKVAKSIRAADAKIIDAAGMIVLPGLVNAHLHTWQTGLRGSAGNWSIPEYLHHMHAKIAPRFTANDTYLGNLVGALNQINAGATTIMDWCHNNATPAHSDAAIDALKESGIRAVFGHGSPKPDAKKNQTPFTHIPHPRSEIERLRKTSLAADDALVTLAMAALGPDFSVWDVTKHDFELAKEFDLLISAHVWGSPHRLNNDGYQKLAKLRLLDERHNMVHGVHLSDKELKILVDAGASLTVTAEVELQMAHGAPITGRVRALGGRPSIGVDVECNISGDMFTVLRTTLQHQRNLDNNETIRKTGKPADHLSITAREALEWATIDSAKALRLDHKIGSVTPGKQADIILVDGRHLNLFPVNDPVEALVFHANGSNVDTVMIAGKIKKRNGKLRYKGIDKKMDLLARSGQRILKDVKLAA